MLESEITMKKDLDELKIFLNSVLDDSDRKFVADTFVENRIAIFAKLSHILSKFS